MKQISILPDLADAQMKEYTDELDAMSTEQLVSEFFTYLDYTEESDSGRVFHPITISSCRVALSPSLSMLLEKLRSRPGT